MKNLFLKSISISVAIFVTISSLAIESEAVTTKAKQSKRSQLLGMSVTGNKESPRSLTIVPWRDPDMNGKAPTISPVWQPTLNLLDPESYRRNVNLFLKQRRQNANQ